MCRSKLNYDESNIIIRDLLKEINEFIEKIEDDVTHKKKTDFRSALLYGLLNTKKDKTQEDCAKFVNFYRRLKVHVSSYVRRLASINDEVYKEFRDRLYKFDNDNFKISEEMEIIAFDGTKATAIVPPAPKFHIDEDVEKVNKKQYKIGKTFHFDIEKPIDVHKCCKSVANFPYSYGEQSMSVPITGVYNVTRNLPISLHLAKTLDERRAVRNFMEDKKEFMLEYRNRVLVFDAGYPSFEMMHYLHNDGFYFVFRLKNKMEIEGDWVKTTNKKSKKIKKTINQKKTKSRKSRRCRANLSRQNTTTLEEKTIKDYDATNVIEPTVTNMIQQSEEKTVCDNKNNSTQIVANNEIKDIKNTVNPDTTHENDTVISDTIKGFTFNNQYVPIRQIRYKIHGKEYNIATNLYDSNLYPVEMIKTIYHKRWQIEEFYKFCKGEMKLDRYTTKNNNTIKISLLMQEIVSIIIKIMIKAYKLANNKPTVSINQRSFLDSFYEFIIPELVKDSDYSDNFLDLLADTVINVPVKDNRHFPRKSKTPRKRWLSDKEIEKEKNAKAVLAAKKKEIQEAEKDYRKAKKEAIMAAKKHANAITKANKIGIETTEKNNAALAIEKNETVTDLVTQKMIIIKIKRASKAATIAADKHEKAIEEAKISGAEAVEKKAIANEKAAELVSKRDKNGCKRNSSNNKHIVEQEISKKKLTTSEKATQISVTDTNNNSEVIDDKPFVQKPQEKHQINIKSNSSPNHNNKNNNKNVLNDIDNCIGKILPMTLIDTKQKITHDEIRRDKI